jgi:type IV pilus assembly protein PilB
MSPQFAVNTKQLSEINRQEEEALTMALSEKIGLPYTDLSLVPINIEALAYVPEELARASGTAVFGEVGKKINMAILTPNNPKVKDVIKLIQDKGYYVALHISSKFGLEKAWERYKEISNTKEYVSGMVDINSDEIERIKTEIKSLSILQNFIDTELKGNRNQSATKVLEIMFAGALSIGASDIHIEPEETIVRLRLRLDGVLQDIVSFDHFIYKHLISRIKLISGLKLNIRTKAQDGRFTIRTVRGDIEIRTSILPGNYGEGVVMRILDPSTVALDIEKLGMNDRVLEVMRKELARPKGMILNTGPTGSGKTTTLYSFLKLANHPDVKIITIEDPIEYHLGGVTQTQVRKGYGFLEGLRAALRQDPDIIMVGEIRDTETARIAINSALTGHLVFSTLHTNTAAGAIPRLLDLGVDIKVMGDALNVLMAQRLVRILCSACKEEVSPTNEEAELIKVVLNDLPEDYKKNVPPINELKIFKAKGCSQCNNTGYKGRMGIFDIILADEAVQQVILTHPSEREVWKAAKGQGIPRMKADGVLKIVAGKTDFAELARVVDLEKD